MKGRRAWAGRGQGRAGVYTCMHARVHVMPYVCACLCELKGFCVCLPPPPQV